MVAAGPRPSRGSAAAPPDPRLPRPRTRTRPRPTRFGVVGAALLGLAITGLVLNFTLPWLRVETPDIQFGSSPSDITFDTQWQNVDRGDLTDNDPGAYVGALVDWPLAAFIVMIVAAVVLVVLDVVPTLLGLQRGLQTVALTAAAYAALLLALTGARWLGFYLSQFYGDREAAMHLHAVPYINLALGLLVLGAAVTLLVHAARYFTRLPDRGRLRRAGHRVPASMAAVAAATLLLMPLLPFFSASGGSAYVDEASLAVAYENKVKVIEDIGRDLALGRLMLWVTLWVSLVAAGAALAARVGGVGFAWPAQALGIVAAPLLTAAVFSVLYYKDVMDLDELGLDPALAFNHVLPVGILAELALYVVFLVKVLVPFVALNRIPTVVAPVAPAP